MNLHLYIPPQSAHPQGVLKSLIFGNIRRYWIQCTHPDTFKATTREFYHHLLDRGYTPESLKPIFVEAAMSLPNDRVDLIRCDSQSSTAKLSPSPDNRLFLHWDYHPRDVGRQEIRQVYKETLGPLLERPPLRIGQLTIAYSTPKNLRRCLTKTQLEEPQGTNVSNTVEHLENLSANL